MKRKVFFDQNLENRFNKDGYVTIPLLDASKLNELFALLNDLQSGSDQTNVNTNSSYELSFFNKDEAYKKLVLEKIYNFFKPLLDEVLDNYQPLIVNLFNKKPGKGEVPLHQNWTFVDESKFTSVSVWIPLCDVNRKNGTLEVVPGTHKSLTPYRSPSIPWVFQGLEKPIKKKYMVPLDLKVGEVGILDDAILHYSRDNTSSKDRGTIQLIMTPGEATAIHYYCPNIKNGEIEVYQVDANFFADFNMHDKPAGVPLIDKFKFQFSPIKNERSFAALVK